MNINIPKNAMIFQGISECDVVSMLSCLNGVVKTYKKNQIIYDIGDKVHSLGVILSGSVHIKQNDIWGNENIISSIGIGGIFAESYACAAKTPLMVQVCATSICEILFLDVDKILNVCSSACEFHSKISHNLIFLLANKNLNLSQKISHISQKTIRQRVLSYLTQQSIRNNSLEFKIPFSRQQLADYLCVDRSALSNELSKMQKEGVIKFDKNWFMIIER